MRITLLLSFFLVVPGTLVVIFILKILPEHTQSQGILTPRTYWGVSAPFSAEVDRVYFHQGQSVDLGDILFTLDTREIERNLGLLEIQRYQEQTQINHQKSYIEARKLYNSQELDMLRLEVDSARLAGIGLSPRELQRREAQLNLTEARGILEVTESEKLLTVACSRIDQLNWEIESQTQMLTKAEVKCPGNGFLSFTTPGEPEIRLPPLQSGGSLSKGQVAGFVQDSSVMDLEVELPIVLFKRVGSEQPAVIKIPGTLNQGKELTVKEKILEIRSPEKPGSFRIKIAWSSRFLTLPPGTSLEVRIPLKRLETWF